MSRDASTIYILSLDTTSKHCSISISRGKEIQIEYNFVSNDNLSATLIPAIDFVLGSINLELSEIGVFGIGIGPGLFTGIRVGLSTLKGMVFKEEKPVVPIVTLEALAYKYKHANFNTISLIDAKRDEVYIGGYRFLQGEMKEIIPPRLIHINELKERLNGIFDFHFVGSGANAHKAFIKKNFDESKRLHRSCFLASEICKMSYTRYLKGDLITDLQQLKPLYIRKPDAETNYPKAQPNNTKSGNP
jgi:tRNA threonylcarbamoyladenosine biosynthesis protein TsaB